MGDRDDIWRGPASGLFVNANESEQTRVLQGSKSDAQKLKGILSDEWIPVRPFDFLQHLRTCNLGIRQP